MTINRCYDAAAGAMDWDKAAALRLLATPGYGLGSGGQGLHTVEAVNRAGSMRATEQLMASGLVVRDRYWTGCLTLTAAGLAVALAL